jgi:quinoprotein glucose dehydrogenase
MSRLRRNIPGVLVVGVLLCVVPLLAQLGSKNNEWHNYGSDAGSTHYSALDLISRDNFKNMTVAWSWKLDNYGGGTTETTPIMVNNILYFTVGQTRTVVAANPGTGETLWIWRPEQDMRETSAPRKITRGVGYWPGGGDGSNDRIITVTPGFRLVALNAKTGVPVSSFGNNGVVDLFTLLDVDYKQDITGKIGNSSAPVVSNDVIVIGPALTQGGTSPSKENVKGDILAFDARTGKRQWIFHTIPRKGEAGYDTWQNGSADYTGNTGAWGPLSADDQLGYVYISTESPTNDGYGGHRPGDNLFSDSEVCLDIKTGKTVWYKQLIHHDIWDYDMPVQPILVDINVDGRPVKTVVQSGKISMVYVFDRTNGKPVWPIPDVPVMQTKVPGEYTAPTQPIPSRPQPFDVVGLKTDDLINFTPELRAEAIKALDGYTYTALPFAPPTIVVPGMSKGTLMVPGFGGGANWQGGAADPETGFVYYGSSTNPSPVGVQKTDPPDPNRADYTAGKGVALPRIQGLPALKPPYGRITGYDMNKGEIAFQIPNGDTPQNYKDIFTRLGLTVPPTGTASIAGLLVTKTLLIAGEGSGGHPLLHAYDKKTGESLGELPMPGSQTALPMTYSYNGRQFIVLAVNGQPAGQLVAFALPVAGGAGGGRGGRGGAAAPAPPAGGGAPAGGARGGGARGGAGPAPQP